jgi:hypothetical protein
MGLVHEKTSGWGLITYLSYPPGNSVNDFIDEKLTTVQYSKFDNVICIIQTLGEHVKIGSIHIKSAFRLFPCYPNVLHIADGCIPSHFMQECLSKQLVLKYPFLKLKS